MVINAINGHILMLCCDPNYGRNISHWKTAFKYYTLAGRVVLGLYPSAYLKIVNYQIYCIDVKNSHECWFWFFKRLSGVSVINWCTWSTNANAMLVVGHVSHWNTQAPIPTSFSWILSSPYLLFMLLFEAFFYKHTFLTLDYVDRKTVINI